MICALSKQKQEKAERDYLKMKKNISRFNMSLHKEKGNEENYVEGGFNIYNDLKDRLNKLGKYIQADLLSKSNYKPS